MIYTGDCLDVMMTLPTGCIRAIATDPPSGTGFMATEWDTFEDRDAFVSWLSFRLAAARRLLTFETGIGAI